MLATARQFVQGENSTFTLLLTDYTLVSYGKIHVKQHLQMTGISAGKKLLMLRHEG